MNEGRLDDDSNATASMHAGPSPVLRAQSPHQSTRTFRGVDDPTAFSRSLQSWRQAVTEAQHLPRYRVVQRLGEGSQGLVYSVADRDCMREVALKTLHAHQCAPDDVSRFIHEAQITAQLEHPGIVPVHDVDVLPDGTVFYTMKKVEGRTLSDLLGDTSRTDRAAVTMPSRPGPSVDDLLNIILKVCDTVAFAHSRGVIHRDLKLRNLMVGRYGEVLVMDWGLAKVLDGQSDPQASGPRQVQSLRSLPIEDGNDIHQTMKGCAVGTPAYMSPEQARGEPADRRSDVYSLGIVLYVSLCGESPYERGRIKYTLEQAASGHWRRLDHHDQARALPKRLVAIVHKCMAFDPGDRYQTTDALAVDIRSFLAGHAVGAYRDTPLDRGVRFVAQQWRGLAIAGGLMVLMAGAGALWRQHDHALHEQQIQALRQSSAQQELMGELEEARRDLEKILTSHPDDRRALDDVQRLRQAIARRGDEQVALRKRQEAATLVRQAAKLVETGTDDNLRRATECYLGALGLIPGDPTIAKDYQRTVALIAQRAEQARTTARAADQAARAAELSQRSAEAEAHGDMRSAIGSLEAALQLDPTDERTKHHATLVAYAAELERVAEVRARQAEAADWIRVCRAALMHGDGAGARDAFDRAQSVDSEHPELPALQQEVQDVEQSGAVAEARALLAQAADQLVTVRTLAGQGEEAPPPRVLPLKRLQATAMGEALSLMYRAQAKAPWHRAPRAALADYYLSRLTACEDRGDLEDSAETVAEMVAETFAEVRAFDDGSRATALAGLASVEARGADLTLILEADQSAHRVMKDATIVVAKGRWTVTDQKGNTCRMRLKRGQALVLEWPTEFVADAQFVPSQSVTVLGQEMTTTAFFALKKPLSRVDLAAALAVGDKPPASAPVGMCGAEVLAYAAWRAQRDGVHWRVPSVAEVRALGTLSEPEFGLLSDGTLAVVTDAQHLNRVSDPDLRVAAVFRLVR